MKVEPRRSGAPASATESLRRRNCYIVQPGAGPAEARPDPGAGPTNCSQWGAMGRRGHNEGAANATDDPPGGRMDSPASPYSQSNGAFKHWRGPPHTLQRWGALPPGKVCRLLHRLRGLLALRRRTVHQSVAPSLQAHSVLSTRK